MALDNPFSLDQATDTDPDAPRRKKLAAFGLQGLVRSGPESASLEQQPLYGGDTSKTVSEAAAEPSQLATERVERAPASQEASPLLGPEERLGNLQTGEEGQNTYQPLSQDERASRVKSFLNQANDQRESAAGLSGGTSRNVGGAGANANLALAGAKTANKLGTSAGKSLANLAGTASPPSAFAANFPGISLSGTPTEGFPINPQGLNFSDEAGKVLNPADYAGAFTGGGDAASNFGPVIGAVGAGVGGALSLASLINSITSGQNDTSKTGSVPNTAMGLGMSSLPILESMFPSLLGAAASGGIGISGLGLAATPMLVMSIMNLIDSLKERKLPYDSSNMSQFRSRSAAHDIPPQLNQYLLGQNDPMSLIGLATGAKPLSPNQEIMMRAGGFNQGDEGYNQMLEGVLNQDPQAIQDFLRSVEFTSGETGGVHNVETQATDTYRRQLAHALGLDPSQTEGMFGEDPFAGFATNLGKSIQGAGYNAQMVANQSGPGSNSAEMANLQDLMNKIPSYADESFSDFSNYSPYYRDPSKGRLTPEEVAGYQDMLRQYMGA